MDGGAISGVPDQLSDELVADRTGLKEAM